MSFSEWDDQYAKLSNLTAQLRSQRGGGSDRQQQIRSLRDGLEELHKKLSALEHSTQNATSFSSSANNRHLTPAEISRRRNLMDSLGRQYDDLFGGSSNDPFMAQQDAMIDELAAGVGRLKDQTRLVADEANFHVNLLNNMDQDMEAATSGLADETRQAERLREKKGLMKLYFIIAGELLLALILIMTGISS